MADDLETRQALRHAGARRRDAEAARADAMSDIATLARQAAALGIPISTIAEDAGLSRPSIYSLLSER